MTQRQVAIDLVDTYLRAGKSVCPHARKATLHYAMDNEALGPMLLSLERFQAGVVIASQPHHSFGDVKGWAERTLVAMFVAAASVTCPHWSRRQVREYVRDHVEPTLRDDHPCLAYLSVRDKPILSICMAPTYPATHPRYSPVPIIVLTFVADVENVEIPGVRDVMAREHGHVYDSKQLVLPLPVT